PVVSPVQFETDALAQLVFVNFAAEPFVENMLIAGKNSFQPQHHVALVEIVVAQQRRQVALRVRQRVVIAYQNRSGFGNLLTDVGRGNHSLVRKVGLAKIAKILASGSGIDRSNLTLDAGKGVPLSRTAPRS